MHRALYVHYRIAIELICDVGRELLLNADSRWAIVWTCRAGS